VLPVAVNLIKGDPIYLGFPLTFNDTVTRVAAGKARACNLLNMTSVSWYMESRWDQATGITVYFNTTGGGISTAMNLIHTSLWSSPDYTQVGVKVGDWAYYDCSTNGTGGPPPEFFANFTVVNIDRFNVTASVSLYYPDGTPFGSPVLVWGNISSGEFGLYGPLWCLIASGLTEGDPIYIDCPVWVDETGTIFLFGKVRVYDYYFGTFNLAFGDVTGEFVMDQATGIGIYLGYIQPEGSGHAYVSMELMSTSLWSPADYTNVGVQVGDWAYYLGTTNLPGSPQTFSVNFTITEIDRCIVTGTLTIHLAGTPESSQTVWGNVSSGEYSSSGIPFPFFLLAANLGKGDPLWIDCPTWINDTMTMAVFGESRICNHLNGSWGDAKVDLSWDQATGISTKANVADMGETGIYMKWSMSSTSLWSPAPTIDQPTEITYIFGTTGHSITWHPSSNVPCNNTIAKDGEEVASANWNGQTITYNVDGLPAGTYVYTCTVNDTIGRRASSAVTVTVNLLPAPTIDQPAATSYTFGTTGHSITWHPSSPWYHNYAITRNETGVASGSWDGQALTCSVDGLTAGTYAYNCTVYDTVGRSASSAVTVTVSAAQQPPEQIPTEVLLSAGGVIAVIVVVGVIVMFRKRR
jgi:hypothetical protein